jgi:hypothetical protein
MAGQMLIARLDKHPWMKQRIAAMLEVVENMRPCVFTEPISNGTPTGQPSTPRQHDDLCASL